MIDKTDLFILIPQIQRSALSLRVSFRDWPLATIADLNCRIIAAIEKRIPRESDLSIVLLCYSRGFDAGIFGWRWCYYRNMGRIFALQSLVHRVGCRASQTRSSTADRHSQAFASLEETVPGFGKTVGQSVPYFQEEASMARCRI